MSNKVLQIAMVAYESVRAFSKTIPEHHPEFLKAPKWEQEVYKYMVVQAAKQPSKLTAQAIHEFWRQYLKDRGWKYEVGISKVDSDKSLHPHLVAFNHLPQDQRMKRYLVIEVINTLLTHLGPLTQDDVADIN